MKLLNEQQATDTAIWGPLMKLINLSQKLTGSFNLSGQVDAKI